MFSIITTNKYIIVVVRIFNVKNNYYVISKWVYI